MRYLFHLPTILFLFYVLALSPFLAWRKFLKRSSVKPGTAPAKPLMPKLQRFRRTALYLVAITLFAVVAAVNSHLHIPFRLSGLDVFVIVAVSGIWGHYGARGIRTRSSPQMQRNRILYAPTTPQELRWALLTALCAGVGEEIVYRGVLFELLFQFSSSVVIAVAVCVVVFAMSHLVQGKAAAMAVGVLGLMFHFLFLRRHTLAVPIGIHVIYDSVIFLAWYRKGKREAAPVNAKQAVGQSA